MNKPIHYLPCSIICHGESELVLVLQLQNKYRRKLNPLSEKNGRNSIQINTINSFLNRRFPDKEGYIKQFGGIICLKNKKTIINHKLFSIMDKDQTSDTDYKAYLNRSLFNNYWWGKEGLIHPIYFYPDMDTVFTNHGFTINKNKHKPAQYFKYLTTAFDDVIAMLLSLKPNESNIRELILYLDSIINCP